MRTHTLASAVTLAAAAALALAAPASSFGQLVVAEYDFEQPFFFPGPINNQAGFTTFPSTAATTSTGVVSAAKALSGTQSLQIDTSPQAETSFYYQVGLSYPAAGRVVQLSYDLDLDPPLLAADPLDRSSYFVGLYNSVGASVGNVGVTSTGAVQYPTATGAATVVPPTGAITSASGFNNITLTLDFATNTGSVALNGVALPVTTPVSPVLASGTFIADVDFISIPSGSDVAYFDNARLLTIVPEPAALAAVAGAGGLLAVRRRRK